jgi:uncharacterized RmlC-like cupin family protein
MQNNTLQNEATIRLVRPGEFSEDTAQTPGSRRLGAIAPERGIPSSMWGGLFTVPAGGQTAIHHRGKQDTVVYVLGGAALLRWGPRGEFSATANPGDFVYVPAYLPHKEINLSEETDFRWVVVRSTPQPIVVNLPDDYWSGSHDEDGSDQPNRPGPGRSLAGL